MTTFEQIKELLFSKLNAYDEQGYRSLSSYISDYNNIISKIKNDRHQCLLNNTLNEYNFILLELVGPYLHQSDHNIQMRELQDFCNQRNYDCNYFFDNNDLEINIDPESNFYYDLHEIIYPQHLERNEGHDLYIFQQRFLEFIKLRFIKNLKLKDDPFLKSKTISNRNSSSKADNPKKLLIDYFVDEFKDEIDSIFELILNPFKPKKIAILTSILSLNKIIFIGEQGQRSFYRSLYDYVDKPYPKNDNFDGIGRQLKFKDEGLEFNTNDVDYKTLNKKFKNKYEAQLEKM